MTPNTLFVGGIDMKVSEQVKVVPSSVWVLIVTKTSDPNHCWNPQLCLFQVDETEIRDFFARFGAVKEVKIITYRGGICKG